MKMKYKFAQLDPRNTDQAKAANEAIFASGPVYGLEVTVPTLAAQCIRNLDHHGVGTTIDTPAACEQALVCPLPPEGSTLATVRCDADSVAAMAVLEARAQRTPINGSVVLAVGLVDRRGPHAEGVERHKPLTISIARVAADFKRPLADRVSWIISAITNNADQNEVAALVAARDKEFEEARAVSTVTAVADGKIAVVTSEHRFATTLGYELSDVVVAYNPTMAVDARNPAKGTYKKYTLAQRDEHVPFDMVGACNELNKLEAARGTQGAWGGQPCIKGSPQGVSSRLSLEEVVAIATKYLR